MYLRRNCRRPEPPKHECHCYKHHEHHEHCEEKCPKCSKEDLCKLLEEYDRLAAITDEHFAKALDHLEKATMHLREGLECDEAIDKVQVQIIEWEKKCLDKYQNPHVKCKCKEMMECRNELIGKIECLNAESYEYACKSKGKLQESRCLDEKLHKVLGEIRCHCYPK